MSLHKSDDFIRGMNLDRIEKRKSWRAKLLGKLSREVRKAARSASVFLISSEHFHSCLLTTDEVLELHAFLSTLFDEFEIICYLRRQDKMALSRYSQELRAGYAPAALLPPQNIAMEEKKVLPPYFDFEALLSRWSQAFGEASIRPRIYSKIDFVGGDVVEDFLRAIGLKANYPVKAVSRNVALSSEAQAVLLSVNKALMHEDTAEAKRLRSALVKYLEQNAPGKSCQPTIAEAQEFYHRFLASNNAVARRWFGEEPLFDAEFSEYPAEPQSACTDRLMDIITGFMLDRRV
ncbi:MAG: hypothetical protein DRR04_00845 [Gammaproteobacteria bacterium]|nr:MAG: hypothetical protein DRQ97_02345 [Gammaproteobacteria bacterium]RLA62150.1 MAG: hypothetical protein DRR04_00845 [Gammaproteobacteria bacterium]